MTETSKKNCNEKTMEIAKSSPALSIKSTRKGKFAYPEKWKGKVPLTIRVLKNAYGMIPPIVVDREEYYHVWVNMYGAVSAVLPDGNQLGLYPSEFEVVEWHNQDCL